MGWLTAWRVGVAGAPPGQHSTSPTRGIVSPWAPLGLSSMLWPDGVPPDADALPVTRAQALAIPAVARARTLTAGTIARIPLAAYAGADRLADQPPWLSRTDQLSTPFHRMLWTVDDHVFYGESLWLRDNAAPSDGGRPLSCSHVAYDAWDVDDQGRVVDADGHPYPQDRVIYLPGPHEGILAYGATALRRATATQDTSAATARTPFRLELHQTTDDVLTRTEITELVADARAALRQNDGVLYTNRALQAITHPAAAEQLLVEARNADAVDVARMTQVPASLLDATSAGASLTYETRRDRIAEWLDYGLAIYMSAISARLSLDDVVPRGQRVAFELDEFLGPAPEDTTAGPPSEPSPRSD